MTDREDQYAAAETLKNEGKLAEAVASLEGLVAKQPDFALAHSALAAWCTRLERHDEAIQHARKVCELEPKDPFSYTALSVWRACAAAASPRPRTPWLGRGRSNRANNVGPITSGQ